jgi:hypothetical protein
MRARGTTFLGFSHVSVRCKVESMPAYMKHGVERPVKNVTADGHPVVLSNEAHTASEPCLVDRVTHVMVTTAKVVTVRTTDVVSGHPPKRCRSHTYSQRYGSRE